MSLWLHSMGQFIEWLNHNPVWVVALAAILGNLSKILEILEKYGPIWAKSKLRQAALNGKERVEVVQILQHFLDEEQTTRKRDRERYDTRLEVLEQERTELLKGLTSIIVTTANQRESVIAALSSVAGSNRALANKVQKMLEIWERDRI